MITRDSIVSRTQEQVSSSLSGEEVILNLENGVYYGLDEVGARVWSLIAEPRAVSAICDALLEEYEVERAQCEEDVVALLRDMQKEGLVQAHADVGAS